MDFNGGAAVSAGVLAGLIMLVPIYMGLVMMPDKMKMDLLKLLGTMMLPRSAMMYPMGLATHVGLSVMFALAHVGLYQAFNLESQLAVWGILFGAGHAVIVGMAMGMMPSMHRGIKDRIVDAPGVMTLSYPRATTMGFVMVHLLFGLLVGVLYEAFS